jgi:alpha-L-fucosidase
MMSNIKFTAIILLIFLVSASCNNFNNKKNKEDAFEEKELKADKMQWWKDAKFGMFIHWGVYSVPAGIYKGHKVKGGGEWIMCFGKIPVEEYKGYAKEFNPVNYNPKAWADLAKETGMKYVVVTTKHHDGFGLFDSKVTNWDVVDATPYKKDLIKPLVDAFRNDSLKIGFYYSQAQDWVHKGGGAYFKKATLGWPNPDSMKIDAYTKKHRGHWDPLQNGDFDEYLNNISIPQVKEILSNYGNIDILWWDTPAEMNPKRADKFLNIIKEYPNLITNNRLNNSIYKGYEGDLTTPENFIPATGIPGKNWEVCMTMNNTWGYKSYDTNWKSSYDLIHKLSEIVSKGGNFLLNVGPNAKGEIPNATIKILKEIGKWMDRNGEAIYGTKANPFSYLNWGQATLKGNKLYLHVVKWPKNNTLTLPLKNKTIKAYPLTEKEKLLEIKQDNDKIYITVPDIPTDPVLPIIVLEFEGNPKTPEIPTMKIKSKVSSEQNDYPVENLFDNNFDSKWIAQSTKDKAWIEIDLGQPQNIIKLAIVEPWHAWNNHHQKIELLVKKEGKWITVFKDTTPGNGFSKEFPPVTGQYFRLNITGDNNEPPALNEWMLFANN